MQGIFEAFISYDDKGTFRERGMEGNGAEIARIRELLASRRDGMSITELAGMLDMNRNTVAKYLDILQMQGAVDGRRKGTSKLFYLSERLPASSLRQVCTRPYWVIDQDGGIVEASPELCSLVAMHADQVLHQSSTVLPVRFGGDCTPDSLKSAVVKGTGQRARAQVRQGDRFLPVTLSLIPVVFASGRPGMAIMVDEDNPAADPYRKDEEAVSADIHALLDDEMEYIVRRTAEGITRYVNEPYCRAAGKTREELLGRPFKPLVSPGDAERIRVHIAGLSVQYPVGTIEYRAVMANGDLRYQRWQDRAHFTSRGELDAITSFGIDITDQVLASQKLKKMQETLEESIVSRTEELRGINRQLYAEIAQRERMEEQLLLAQFAMDKASDMVFWIGRDARIRYANDRACESLQYARNELLDRRFGDVVPACSSGEWDLLWEDLRSGGQVFRETDIIRKDGARVPAELRLTYLEYRDRQFVYCSLRDLSERIRMDRAVKEANRKLNVYTSIARHDIQNKITVLLAYLGRTKKAVTDPHLLDYLNHQEQAAKAIRAEITLTREFKDMGMHPPAWQNIRAIAEASAGRYRNRPVRVTMELPEAEIYADSQLGRVFDRLFERSLAGTTAASEIRISGRLMDGRLCISFEDNGPGIPRDHKEQVFELQGGDLASRDLFIAREILSLTGISLTETGEPGRGARFELQVPESYFRNPENTSVWQWPAASDTPVKKNNA
jgi:PAS domain S-box-containing protein